MKPIKLLFVTVALLLAGSTVQAQLLKKLGDTAKKAAENAVTRQTEKRTDDAVNKTIDGAFDGNNDSSNNSKQSSQPQQQATTPAVSTPAQQTAPATTQSTAPAATAQKAIKRSTEPSMGRVSYSGTEYQYNKEYAKVWRRVEPNNMMMRSERFDTQKGETSIMIFRQDSMKMYMYSPETKKGTTATMDGVQDFVSVMSMEKKGGTRTSNKKFMGLVEIEGYECHHYFTEITTTWPNGQTETGCVDTWIFEPYDVQMQSKAVCGYDSPITLKGFQMGEQPAHLFEIPKDVEFANLFQHLGEVENMLDGLMNLGKGLKK